MRQAEAMWQAPVIARWPAQSMQAKCTQQVLEILVS